MALQEILVIWSWLKQPMYIHGELKNSQDGNGVLHLESAALLGDSDRCFWGAEHEGFTNDQELFKYVAFKFHRTTID